jgi:hypothetical protein
MDLDIFLTQLAATAAHLQWDVTGVGLLRGHDADGGKYCPVTAVCGAAPDQCQDWDRQGQAAGLATAVSSRIVRAADNTGMGLSSRQLAALRSQLLAAVGLAPDGRRA